jgi:hypothetical protein
MNQPIKKSFNINADLAQKVDDIIQDNPGLSFTFIMNQALEAWTKNPSVMLHSTQGKRSISTSIDEMDEFMKENSSLMDKLAK